MTFEADIGLGELVTHRIINGHYIVASCARIAHSGMSARLPIRLQTAFMALGTDGITLLGGNAFLGYHEWRFLARRFQMFAHGAVTGLAAAIRQSPAHLRHGIGPYVFFVALHTLGTAFDKSRAFHLRIQRSPVYVFCLDGAHLEEQDSRHDQLQVTEYSFHDESPRLEFFSGDVRRG